MTWGICECDWKSWQAISPRRPLQLKKAQKQNDPSHLNLNNHLSHHQANNLG
eukprot:m.59143 g.59143  ORF g.59143 m.59143 type:complete len:52 (-) comp22666_c0_seq1:230-385(-)